jgi:hypothetical protein
MATHPFAPGQWARFRPDAGMSATANALRLRIVGPEPQGPQHEFAPDRVIATVVVGHHPIWLARGTFSFNTELLEPAPDGEDDPNGW